MRSELPVSKTDGGSAAVASPCISVCVLDERDICTGCFRNVEEIAGWSEMSNSRRREVVLAANCRRRDYFKL